MRYLALLRGINVGGKNKVSMAALRECFAQCGFWDVSTYINSGNIFFSSDGTNEIKLVERCERVIDETFGFRVVVMVISGSDYIEAMHNAPSWWGSGDGGVRSDALFVIPPTTPSEVRSELKLKPDSPDEFSEYGQVIFWSLPREKYSRSIVPKIIGTPIYKTITMRSSTTARKLLVLFEAGV